LVVIWVVNCEVQMWLLVVRTFGRWRRFSLALLLVLFSRI
jgi:hypothetical protein